MWEKCPICNGSGEEEKTFSRGNLVTQATVVCTTCNGKKIISSRTGLPPSSIPDNNPQDISPTVKGDGFKKNFL
jgi:DnaJ-class molecular chaperone